MDFPRTVDEITPEWLTKVLRESGAIGDARIKSFSSVGLDGGVVGEVHRLHLEYTDSSGRGPSTAIAKIATADVEKRLLIGGRGFYEREVQFYQHLNSGVGVPTSSVYFSEYDSGTAYFMLLLEDLGQYRAVDQKNDCSFEDTSSALQTLSVLHSKWWKNDRLAELGWLFDFTDAERVEQMAEGYSKALERFLEIGNDFLPAGYEPVARKYGESIRTVIADYAKNPVTLLHGDFRLGNLLFNDEVGATDRVYAFDWQLASKGMGAVDVAYFIGWSLSAESRREHEGRLLADYHDSLIDRGVRDYSYDRFSNDVRLGAFRLVQIATGSIVNLGQHLLDTDDGIRLIKTLCNRLQIVVDWNCEEVIPR